MNRSYDALVMGAGIVGAACALELATAGMRVAIVERDAVGSGATAAGMGHIVVMDDSEAQFALTSYSQMLWNALVFQNCRQMPSTNVREPFGWQQMTKRWQRCSGSWNFTPLTILLLRCSMRALLRTQNRICEEVSREAFGFHRMLFYIPRVPQRT